MKTIIKEIEGQIDTLRIDCALKMSDVDLDKRLYEISQSLFKLMDNLEAIPHVCSPDLCGICIICSRDTKKESQTNNTEPSESKDVDGENYLDGYGKELCKHCNIKRTKEGHDGCIGTIEGIMNACCGHGENRTAYIQFFSGNIIQGEDAILILNLLK